MYRGCLSKEVGNTPTSKLSGRCLLALPLSFQNYVSKHDDVSLWVKGHIKSGYPETQWETTQQEKKKLSLKP